MKTWLCPGLPRLCNDNHEPIKQTSDYGQPKSRTAMWDEVSRPQFVFFVAAGAAHLVVTVTCFTCLETLRA